MSLYENIHTNPVYNYPSPNCDRQLGEAREGVKCISAPHRKSSEMRESCIAI
jgi:hypothetical protein